MILTCPECSTRYLTENGSIGPNGRTVRCAKCDATWFQPADTDKPTADELALEDQKRDVATALDETRKTTASVNSELGFKSTAAASMATGGTVGAIAGGGAHVALRDQQDAKRLSRRHTLIRVIWAVTMALLLIAAVLAFMFRQDIVNRLPATASLYNAVGLTTYENGLVLDPPSAELQEIDGQTVMMISGQVRNVSKDGQKLPALQLSLHTPGGEPIGTWTVDLPQARLEAGEKIVYSSEFPNPPIDARDVRYQFAG